MSETAPNLPAIQNAPVPVKYEAARQALAECSRVDECKDWSDKAAALAAYAKQAKDSTLHNLALRIQQRAQRRMGELLKQVPSAQGKRADLEPATSGGRTPEVTRFGREGDHPPGSGPTGGRPLVGETRTQAAKDAGLSEHQRKTALRIASVPEVEFDKAVESDHPPTVSEMAMRGTVSKPPAPTPDVPAADPALVVRAHRWLREFAAFCGTHDPAAIALGCQDSDMLRGHVETIDRWLDRFVTRLPSDQETAA